MGTGGYLVGAKRWMGAGWGLVDIWWVIRGGWVLGGDWWISGG